MYRTKVAAGVSQKLANLGGLVRIDREPYTIYNSMPSFQIKKIE